MGRTVMYAAIAALAVFLLSDTFLLKHGGESVAAVQHVSVHDLTTGPSVFDGESVATTGLLGFSEEHGRYQLVDEGNFAIIIRQYASEEVLDGLVGRRVRVSGVFGISPESGVYIDADSVGAVAD